MLQNQLLSAYAEKTENGYLYESVWTAYVEDALSQVFLYAAIALAAVLLAIGLFVCFKRKELLSSYAAKALAVAAGFASAVIIAMLSLKFYAMYEKGYIFGLVLYPSLTLAAVVILGAAATYIASLFSGKAMKLTGIISASLAGAALVALLVCFGVYYASGDAENNNGVTVSVSENVALYLSAAALVLLLVLAAVLLGRGERGGFDSKAISYAAIFIAMSFALSYLSPIHMPQGGSVTIASLLPLMIYSYMFGIRKGVFAGFAYGLLQAVQDPWIVHPAQFLLDYPIAFACIGLAGLFSRQKKLDKYPQVQFLLGAIVASVLRFVCHVLSGVFAFSAYAFDKGMTTWVYSLAYSSFVFVDIAIAIAVGVVVFSSKTFVREARKCGALARKPSALSTSAPSPEPDPAPESVPEPASSALSSTSDSSAKND